VLFRLLKGLFLGGVLGLMAALALERGLGITSGAALPAYLFAAVLGVVVGLFLGKPIWSQTGKIEAGLKAFFGAVLASGGLFALRKWFNLNLDLTAFGMGAGTAGQMAPIVFPMIGSALGSFFEVDNTGDPEEEKTRVAPGAAPSKKRVEADEADEEEVAAPPAAKKRK
jgi:hypothetical protein